jgi:hypothetical protein
MRLSNIAMWPIWTVELFTTAKSFSANPIIGSKTLNRWGLHVARVRLAQLMTRWRWLFMGWLLPADIKRQFREQGYVKIENFLPPEEFARLREEILHFNGELRRMVQGDTYTYQGLLDEGTVASMPACRKLLKDRRFRSVMMYGGSAYKMPMFFAHCIVNGVGDGAGGDPQKDFHSDTFHPTMKAWLFLDHVDDAIGPFNYVPGSHRPSSHRLKWDYENSVTGKDLANKYAQRGSLRISPEELQARGFNEPVAMKVPANTLVMADTYGFHRRGDASPGSTRLAIYAYSRSNPFNPLPGFAPVSWRSRIEQFFTKANLKVADAAAARNKTPASWHIVPPGEIAAHAQQAPTELRKSA